MENVSIIAKVFEQHNIRQRESDGYLSATDMCKAFGKLFGNYHKSQSTHEYINALNESIPSGIDLICIINNGSNNERGTWVHPRIAIHLAQWLSPKFSIAVTDWVIRYLSGDITLVADIVKQHEDITGTKVTNIDFNYEHKLLELEERRSALLKSKAEIEQLQIMNTERKRQLIIDLDTFKGDAQIYMAFKNTIMNTFGLISRTCDAADDTDVTKNKDISTLYYETLDKYPSNGALIKLGKNIKAEYINKYNEHPLKAAKHVNGAIRDIYVYPSRDYMWIKNIIRDSYT